MKTQVIKIGNSRGIRIPKAVLEQTGLNGHVELEVEGEQIIIRPAHPPRKGWKEAFHRMSESGDDKFLDKEYIHRQSFWDENEWEW